MTLAPGASAGVMNEEFINHEPRKSIGAGYTKGHEGFWMMKTRFFLRGRLVRFRGDLC